MSTLNTKLLTHFSDTNEMIEKTFDKHINARLSYFIIMVTSQIIKIAEENGKYIELKSIHTHNELTHSQTILSFKELARKIYNIR